MQVFEVVKLDEFPYMMTKEIHEGEIVSDVIKENKVYLIVDHNTNRIWTCNGYKSSFKLQIYGNRLAQMLKEQLQLRYNIFPLNKFSKKDDRFQEIMEKPLSGGPAQAIEKGAFLKFEGGFKVKANVKIFPVFRVKQSLEYINQIPPPENFLKKFMIVGGDMYTDEEITESFVTEKKTIKKSLKLGQLNRGFTFFENYSTRLIINDRKIQGIELYIHEKDKSKTKLLEVSIPLFTEEKFNKSGSLDTLFNAFQMPEELPKED